MTYNTKLEDLSKERQFDYRDTLNRLGYGDEWGKVALTINPKENWEQFGFGAFNLSWFQKKVNGMVNTKKVITVDTLQAELDDFKKYVDELIDFVNQLEERIIELEEK